MKHFFRSIWSAICRQLFSRPAFTRLTLLVVAVGLCVAGVFVFALMDVSEERAALVPTTAVFIHTLETPGALLDAKSSHHARATDYARALARALMLKKAVEREDLVRDLLSAWGEFNAADAASWIAALEDPAARRFTRSALCLSIAKKNPRQAIALALDPSLDEEDDGGLLEYLTMQWCEKEIDTAVDWVCQQPPGEWRDRLLARASFVLSKSNPSEAAHLVSTLQAGNLQNEAAMAVLHQWAQKDGAAALQWAKAFTQPALRERAFAEISNLRARVDAQRVE